jgi:hypothetical protein
VFEHKVKSEGEVGVDQSLEIGFGWSKKVWWVRELKEGQQLV